VYNAALGHSAARFADDYYYSSLLFIIK